MKPASSPTLADLPAGARGTLAELRLPEDDAARLMALGFIPGTQIVMRRAAPGGDPVVYQVDGTEIAIRRETARCLILQESA
jgi:ferrous iron transport protein A